MPKPAYSQLLRRTDLTLTRFDHYFREFANLSEQEILNYEILTSGYADWNQSRFGFIGRYDEYRSTHDSVHGDFVDSLDYWHLARKFDSLSPPYLNKSFIECDAMTGGSENPLRRIFAVKNRDGLLITVGTQCRTTRPLPYMSDPGLLDHF